MNTVKGLSALRLGRDLDICYKTAFVLVHKLREALSAETVDMGRNSEVKIDGGYFGSMARPENRKEDRKDCRLKANLGAEFRVLIVKRQCKGSTLTYVTKREFEGVKLAEQHPFVTARYFHQYAAEAA